PTGIQIAPEGDGRTAGESQLTVTDDGGVLVIYQRRDNEVLSMHATRIELGANPTVSDRAIDLARVPALLVTSGAQILAVSVPANSGSQAGPTFETFETRILDGEGRTVSGPFTVATGDPGATVIATQSGFAALHSGGGRDPRLTPIGRDGK